MLSVEDRDVHPEFLLPRAMLPFFDRFRRRGGRPTAEPGVPPHPFDRAHGTDTGGLILPEQLRTAHPQSRHSSAYYGMSPSRFRAALELWLETPPAYPVAEYSFLDLGCGKGRALLLATELPFRQAIGVELHRGLARTARRNLRVWGRAGQARCPAQVLTGDATEVHLPPGPCLVYLFHPFSAAAMARLIEHLRRCVPRRPPDAIDVIYFNPEAGRLWSEQPGAHLLWSRVLPMSPEDAAADPFAHEDDLCEAYRWSAETEPAKVQPRPPTT